MEVVKMSETVKKMAQSVKHFLITNMGKTVNEATDEEFYRALSWVLREEVMINWTATTHTHQMKKAKRVYYFSLEWLPGRSLVNNMTNIASMDLVKLLLKDMGREYQGILNAEAEPGLGNGGLGRLAACYLDSLATQHLPAVGYGLRYQYGIFEQELWYGVQVERPDTWLLNEYPWEMRKDAFAQTVRYSGKAVKRKNSVDETVYSLADCEDVRALPYDVPIVGHGGRDDFSAMTLRLWTTKESPRNFQLARFNAGDLAAAATNTSVTDVLYPNDKFSLGVSMRIKQEYLLVAASIQDIFRQYFMMFDTLDEFPNIIRIQINDTHPALTIAEMMRVLTEEYNQPWAKAWEITSTCCSYTNHTVLKESLEEWDSGFLKEILPRQFKIIEKINFDFCNQIRQRYPNDEERVRKLSIIENERVRMGHLAIVGSHTVNGVAALHSQILKTKLFPEFDEMFPGKFTNVTNGVTQRRWLLSCNPPLADFITGLIGSDWIVDLKAVKKIADFANEPEVQERFMAIKHDNKKRLIHALVAAKKAKYGDGVDLENDFFLEADALFDIQIKRIHEYKRQLMKALHVMMLYNDLKKNPEASKIKRMVVIAGKAAPGYEMAKDVIRLFYMLARKINSDPIIGKKLKVVFVENYNVSKAEVIIPAADLSNQISTAGQEASGTGNMKLSLNGALTIGTEDGANVEMRQEVTDQWWPFRFGMTSDEVRSLSGSGSYKPDELLKQDVQIAEAVELLNDGSLAENEVEEQVLRAIYHALLTDSNPDRYFVLKDLRSYYDAQKKVEELYLDRAKWAEYCLHNIAGMGKFSSDESVSEYAKKIWGIEKCPIDHSELLRIRKEFRESARVIA